MVRRRSNSSKLANRWPPPKLDKQQQQNDNSPTQSQQEKAASGSTGTRLLMLLALLVAGGGVSVVIMNRDEIKETVDKEVVPQLEQIKQELRRLSESLQEAYQRHSEGEKRPGVRLADLGARAKYPVVMVPGFVTSGLEVWSAKDCARKSFRQRIWTALSSVKLLAERNCWQEHMMLDPNTGLDPDGIKLRAASGFEAADVFLANYWVWSKLIENLADLGYTPSEMTLAAYDWRLSFSLMETRDGYFSNLKTQIELLHKRTGHKAVLASHSMGVLVVHYFLAWVTSSEGQGGGGGGKKWVDQHLHAFCNIAGAHLGVAKAAPALLSGEMGDTAVLGDMGEVLEVIFSRRYRRDLFTTWGSLSAMLPLGGEALWGTGADLLCDPTRNSSSLQPTKFAKVDPFCPGDHESSGPLLVMTTEDQERDDQQCPFVDGTLNETVNKFLAHANPTTEDTVEFLHRFGEGIGLANYVSKFYSLQSREKPSHKSWHDPTRTPLPHAPHMKVYCLYGTGIESERGYYYKRQSGNVSTEDPPFILDVSVYNENLKVKNGVRFSDGDGSVPLLSLGYLCYDAWTRRDSGLNPSGAKVFTREYKDESDLFQLDDPGRGGPKSGTHVDILGNSAMTEDFLRVVSDFGVESVSENRIVSDIANVAAEINGHPNGGIHQNRKWIKSE